MRRADVHGGAAGGRLWPVLLAAVIAAVLAPLLAVADRAPSLLQPVELAVQAEPVTLSRIGSERFGALEWRGGLALSAEHDAFGGFSGLVASADGARLLAVSDRGLWWQARVLRDESGRLAGVSGKSTLAPMLSSKGRPLADAWLDAEGVAPFDARRLDGPLLVAFERRARLAIYDWGARGPQARARYLFLPVPIRRARENGEIEAIARFWNGPLAGFTLGVIEKGRAENGERRAFLWKDKRVTPFFIASRDDFRITDVAVLPDGTGFITLERRFIRSLTSPPAFAMRLFRADAVRAGAVLEGRLLMQAMWPVQAIDNMEGLALYERGGELRLLVISDDNYNRTLQRTLLFEFALPKPRLRTLLEALTPAGERAVR